MRNKRAQEKNLGWGQVKKRQMTEAWKKTGRGHERRNHEGGGTRGKTVPGSEKSIISTK